MTHEEILYLVPYIVSLAIILGVFLYSWHLRHVKAAGIYTWFVGGQALTILGFIIEMVSPDLNMKIIWDKFQWLTSSFLVIIPFLLFSVQFSEYKLKNPRLAWGYWLSVPVIFTLILLTDNTHHLLYPNPHLSADYPFPELQYRFTTVVYIYSIFYIYAVNFYGTSLLIRRAIQTSNPYRPQYLTVAGGMLIPLILSTLALADIRITPQRDIAPFSAVLGNLIVAWGLFRYRLFNIVPIAREHVLENISDLVLVLDASDRIIDVNQAALGILGKKKSEVIGKLSGRVLSQWPDLVERFENINDITTEFKVAVSGQPTYYELNISPVQDQGKRLAGRVIIAHDITQRKTLEDELRQLSGELEQRVQDRTEELRVSEARYRVLVETSPDAITLADLNGRILMCNQRTAALHGFERVEDIIGLSTLAFSPPEDLPRATELMRRTLQEGSIRDIECVLLKRDGSRFPAELSTAVVVDVAGNPTAVVGITRDITERKQAEEALQLQSRMQELLMKISTTYINLPLESVESAIRISLGELAEFVGADRAYIFDYDFHKQVAINTHEWCGKGVTPQIAELQAVPLSLIPEWAEAHRRGEPMYVPDVLSLPPGVGRDKLEQQDIKSLLAVPLMSSGVCIGSVGFDSVKQHHVYSDTEQRILTVYANMLVNIRQRKQAEEALQESEQRFKQLSSLTSEGIMIHESGVILDANQTFAELGGYSDPESLIGKNGLEIIPFTSESRQRVLAHLRTGSAETYEIELVKSDGSILPTETSGRMITYQGRQARLVSMRDITVRKRAEETLRQQLAELEAVHTVSAALRTAQTLDKALPIVLDQTLAALETNAGTIWLYHPASDELRVAINRGWFSQFEELPIKPGEGIAGTVFSSGQAHLSTEFARDPLARPLQAGEIPAGWSGACVPIRTAAEAIGVLFVSMPLPRQITPEQMKLLNSLAEMAGAALHRMRLYEETERQLKFLQALHEIDRVISASFDLRLTLQLLIEHTIAELGVDAADVLLLNPHLLTLDYVVGRGFRTSLAQTAHIRLGESFAGRAALERRVVHADRAQIQESPPFAAFWASEGFAAYYSVPLIAKGEVRGVLEVYQRTPFNPEPHWLGFLETFAAQAAIAIDNMQLFDNMQRSNLELTVAYDSAIEGWSSALDLRDEETEGHTQRVTELTERLARVAGMSEDELTHLRRGALLHDIGKMGIPDAILLKPDKLTDEEWIVMRKHPTYARDMLSRIEYLKSALDIPYCHHEKWDGTGYPQGLKGEQIPLAARLFAVVDVWDALRNDRPYRPGWPEEKVIEYIREQIGMHFDPKAVEIFLRLLNDN